MINPTLQIGLVPPKRRLEALRVLVADLELGSSDPIRVARDLLARSDPHGLAGLLEGRRGNQTVGTVWIQRQPGSTALVWPPGLAAGEDEGTARRLMSAACGFLDRHQVALAQALLERSAGPPAERLGGAGFSPLADLDYLVCGEAGYPTTPPARKLDLATYQRANQDRLVQIVRQTYEGTLDCPQVSGVRNIQAVLAGYRATGRFDPSYWLIARRGNRDIGCLLLADHPLDQQLELVYMGVVPGARGSGWGRVLARHAQWLARQARRPRLVLAVDRQNFPARAAYEAVGFVCWTTRQVWARTCGARSRG